MSSSCSGQRVCCSIDTPWICRCVLMLLCMCWCCIGLCGVCVCVCVLCVDHIVFRRIMSTTPPTLSRQGSGIIAFEGMSPQMQRQMSFSTASHSIIPEKHMNDCKTYNTSRNTSRHVTSRNAAHRFTWRPLTCPLCCVVVLCCVVSVL